MLREILLVTTFKEFDGGRDSKIQEFWLSHLHKQTYKNFKLIVTNFRENFVEAALIKSRVPFEFYQSQSDCLYSLTDMFENTLKHVKLGKQIILFPSPDHMFDPNLFQVIINHFEKGGGGTTFPHPQYLSMHDYKNNKMYDEYYDRSVNNIFDYDPNKHLPEIFYFDADLIISQDWSKNFFKEKVLGTFPGIAFHLFFLSSMSKLTNLIFETKSYKIISHVNPATNKLDKVNFLSAAHISSKDWKKNEEIVIRFCKAQNLKKKIYLGSFFRSRKLIMFSRFKPIGELKDKFNYFLFKLKFTIFPGSKFLLKSKIFSLLNKFQSIK